MNDHPSELRERLIALTRDLVLIPGTEERPEDLRRAMEWLGNHLEGITGLRVTHHESHGVPSLVAMPADCAKPDVLMCGHIDVVHHADPAVYRSTVSEGRIVGPGSGDMKGNVAILLELLRAVRERVPGAPLALAVTGDEERGGEHGTRALFDEFGLECSLAIVPDGGSIDEIVVEEKGILHVELRSTGVSCHSARPWLGRNALEQIVRSVDALRLAFPPGDDAGHWYGTCSLTRLDAPNRSFNRVPAHARATLDIRFPAPATVEEMMERVRGSVAEGVDVELVVGAEPSVLSPDPAFLRVCGETLGRPLVSLREHGGSDARFIANRGIPVLMTRPECGRLHAPDEWIEIDSMLVFYQIYERYLLERFAGLDVFDGQGVTFDNLSLTRPPPRRC